VIIFFQLVNRKDNHEEILTGDSGIQCLAAALDTVILGGDTILGNLHSALFALAANPHIQSKLREELLNLEKQGNTRIVEDKKQFPYFQAFFMEIHRHVVQAGLGAPHRVICINIMLLQSL